MEVLSPCLRQESLVHLLIAAAGSGRRMGADRNKLLLPLAGRPLIAWTLEAALRAERISWIGLVGQEVDRPAILSLVENAQKPSCGSRVVTPARNQSCVVSMLCLPRPTMF